MLNSDKRSSLYLPKIENCRIGFLKDWSLAASLLHNRMLMSWLISMKGTKTWSTNASLPESNVQASGWSLIINLGSSETIFTTLHFHRNLRTGPISLLSRHISVYINSCMSPNKLVLYCTQVCQTQLQKVMLFSFYDYCMITLCLFIKIFQSSILTIIIQSSYGHFQISL
jgi:hypothetical protein